VTVLLDIKGIKAMLSDKTVSWKGGFRNVSGFLNYSLDLLFIVVASKYQLPLGKIQMSP